VNKKSWAVSTQQVYTVLTFRLFSEDVVVCLFSDDVVAVLTRLCVCSSDDTAMSSTEAKSSGDSLAPPVPLLLRQSSVQRAYAEYQSQAEASIKRLREAKEADSLERPKQLEVSSLCCHLQMFFAAQGCVFVGHTATDMDSIASAIGAAELFNGVPARASDVNSETEFALQVCKRCSAFSVSRARLFQQFDVPVPKPFLEVVAGQKVCCPSAITSDLLRRSWGFAWWIIIKPVR